MSDDVRARLIAAAATGEIIRILYHRGSQPGAVREIRPVAISDDEVTARDIASGIDKTFKLAHIGLAGARPPRALMILLRRLSSRKLTPCRWHSRPMWAHSRR